MSIFDVLEQSQSTECREQSDSDTEEDEVEQIERPRRAQSVRYEYKEEKVFENAQECDAFVADEKCWKKHDAINTTRGLKTVYRCTNVKRRGGVCLADIYTISDTFPGDPKFVLYRRQCDHTCATAPNKKKRMSEQLKTFIEKCIDRGMTPKVIMQQIRKDFPQEEVEKKQVDSFYKTHRTKLFGKAKTSIEDMIVFCDKNLQVPDELDTAFVLDYDHSPIDDIEPLNFQADEEEDEHSEPWFRYIVTTKRFLMNAIKSNNLCADATKKIIIQKYPVLVFGTTDFDATQHFHLVAVMVSKYEREADFEFSFAALKNGVQRILHHVYQPKMIMRDAALAIHNGFVKVFGEGIISLMCHVHMMRAVDRRPVPPGVDKQSIKRDISSLRLAYSKERFDEGSGLFLDKWKTTAPGFTDYFDSTWLRQNSNFFNGSANRMVHSNNPNKHM